VDTQSPMKSRPIRLEQCVGSGRVGQVYEGYMDGERVAVKCVPTDHASTLFHAWRVLQQLDHPNIIHAHSCQVDDDRAMLVMDLAVDALDRVVMDSRTLRVLLGDLTDALHHLHSRGWVHRDVKPENLLWDRHRVLLSDFGLAAAHPAPEPIAPCGTPAYMAPEVFGWELSPAADWYALGVTLYELLTGRLPFDRDSLQADLFAKQQGVYARLLGPGLTPWVPVVDGLLSPQVANRWGYVELRDYLDTLEEIPAFSASA